MLSLRLRAAAVAVAVAGIAVAVGVPGDENGGVASTPGPTPAVSTPAATAALVGTWRPTFIVGFDINDYSLGNMSPLEASQRAPVTFRSDKTWHGSDGCNGIAGRYDAKDDRTFTAAAPNPQTLAGCDNVPHVRVLQDAARFTIESSTLTFYNEQSVRIATHVRM